VAVPLLKRAVVQHLLDAVLGRDVEVIFALRADVEELLGFLAIDRRLAAGAADPQPFRHTPLGLFDGDLGRDGHGEVPQHSLTSVAELVRVRCANGRARSLTT
jgi:hypothetical protein